MLHITGPGESSCMITDVTEMSRKPRLPTSAGSTAHNPRGGTGCLELPPQGIAASLPSTTPATNLPMSQISAAHGLSVLIADDVAMNCDVAGAILRAAGHEVMSVFSGAEAIEAIKITTFDVVLMDVRMPQMDGLEATRRIRSLESGSRFVPVVALTAQDFPTEIEECRQAGMNGHVSKPFIPDELTAAVERAALAGSAQATVREPGFVMVRPSAPIVPAIGSKLPLIDLTAFSRIASLLAPKPLVSYLRNIAALAQALLVMLDGPDIPEYNGNDYSGAAHIVAGTAGMFGFERLTAASKQFERATESGSPVASPIGEALRAAIQETLPEIRSRMVGLVDA
jgi:CheY-like chemotaxis protein